MAKCLISKIQKFREKLGLKPWNKVDISIYCQEEIIKKVIEQRYSQIKDVIQTNLAFNLQLKKNDQNLKLIELMDYQLELQILLK